MDYNNSFSIIFLLFIFLLFLWIGAQFPLEKFLSYGRILIFYYKRSAWYLQVLQHFLCDLPFLRECFYVTGTPAMLSLIS